MDNRMHSRHFSAMVFAIKIKNHIQPFGAAMTSKMKIITLLTCSAVSLGGCIEIQSNGTPLPKASDGAVIGGLIGGLLGSRSDDNKLASTVVGAAVGATVGGMIGYQLDKQELELRNSLQNGDVQIVNTGSELIVTLPEAITFDTDSSYVRINLRADLATLAQNLKDFPDTTVDILGHTDNVGDAAYNQQLSTSRAESVYLILADAGVSTNRMRAIGRGENEPKASNLTPEGRAENRRVEIIIRPIQ